MTSTPPSGHKPARRRAAVAVLIAAAALGTAAIPAFAARATYISPGNYLDLVIGRGWTEAASALAHRDRYRSAFAVLSGPAGRKTGTAAAAQPTAGRDNHQFIKDQKLNRTSRTAAHQTCRPQGPWTAGSIGPDRTAPCDWRRGVIGMLRKLSRKARGVHHGPFSYVPVSGVLAC